MISAKGVRRFLVRGSMPPYRLRLKKFRKFDYEMVHPEVYLNKYVVSIAPFSTPAFTPTPIQKTALFACFRFLIFIHFSRGQLTPFAPIYGRPWSQLKWSDVNKSTQLHDAFIGHARQRHDYTSCWLAAAKTIGRSVFGQFSTRVFKCGPEFSERNSVQFGSCAVDKASEFGRCVIRPISWPVA